MKTKSIAANRAQRAAAGSTGLSRLHLRQIEEMSRRHAQQARIVIDVLMQPALQLAGAARASRNKDRSKLMEAADGHDAPIAWLIEDNTFSTLFQMTKAAVAILPSVQQAERVAWAVRIEAVAPQLMFTVDDRSRRSTSPDPPPGQFAGTDDGTVMTAVRHGYSKASENASASFVSASDSGHSDPEALRDLPPRCPLFT